MNLCQAYDLSKSNPSLCFKCNENGHTFRFLTENKKVLIYIANLWHETNPTASMLSADWHEVPNPSSVWLTWPEVAHKLKQGDPSVYISQNGKHRIRTFLNNDQQLILDFLGYPRPSVLEFFDHNWSKLQ